MRGRVIIFVAGRGKENLANMIMSFESIFFIILYFQTQEMVKIIENYVLSEPIGVGSYGTVYKAKNKLSQAMFAVKVIPLEKFLE